METTIAGRQAWYTTVLITRGFDLSQCDAGQLVLWETDDQVREARPGELHELYITEVDREVIVIDATSTPALSPDELRALRGIVSSIELQS